AAFLILSRLRVPLWSVSHCCIKASIFILCACAGPIAEIAPIATNPRIPGQIRENMNASRFNQSRLSPIALAEEVWFVPIRDGGPAAMSSEGIGYDKHRCIVGDLSP